MFNDCFNHIFGRVDKNDSKLDSKKKVQMLKEELRKVI